MVVGGKQSYYTYSTLISLFLILNCSLGGFRRTPSTKILEHQASFYSLYESRWCSLEKSSSLPLDSIIECSELKLDIQSKS